jgi:hypothetical protein
MFSPGESWMIFATKALPYFLCLTSIACTSIAMAASTADSVHSIYKADGTVGLYKFLPVHFEPSQQARVNERLRMLDMDAKGIPATYHIPSAKLPEIRDQQQRGTCAYFATVGLMEAYYMTKSPANKKIRLSEECLVDVRNWEFDQGANYTGKDKPDQRPDPNGDLPNSIVMTVQGYGVPLAGTYGNVSCEYQGVSNGADVALSDYQGVFASANMVSYGKGVKFDENSKPTVAAIKNLIAHDIPVEVGILVYNEYFNGSDWRFNAAQDTDSNLAGGHAVQLVGYSTQGSRTIFTFKNSWGQTWGVSGYGTLDDKILSHSWGYDPSFDFIVSMHD